jgi:hypothetical protein
MSFGAKVSIVNLDDTGGNGKQLGQLSGAVASGSCDDLKALVVGSHGDGLNQDSSITFGWFVRNRFLPLKEASWKEETAKVKTLLIQQDLIDEFEDVPMAYLRDIFAEAADQDFLPKDPARKVKVGFASSATFCNPSACRAASMSLRG